ncbi:SDR family NAD(P)-dependent oxidoreductase [Occultella gossypii]|uniref:SDR family NAD(P)-dependent oxidoreductase n=1 Tax=Occultella gossypii TaxID=2800820 RepID=A0ABS7SID6_9MICO|nr:SDR family NAD(P)-dependent oxidoreductase [Occultella gossypii]MBZ2199708.1 SDR family NAD(P)-dependent oxidoreductase [Occultella gossypii]
MQPARADTVATYVMTGGSSGFGALTAATLAGTPKTRVIIGARSPVDPADSLDVTGLDSVRAFATSVRERLGGSRIDGLLLNAGGIRSDADGRTTDGYETTFVLNHLGHYLLARLLLPVLAAGARIVLTTSGTHDPATKASLAVPRHADAGLLAHPERDPDRDAKPRRAGQRAYTAAKLCAILTARSLRARPEVRERTATVIAFDPGQVFGTGLVRDLPAPMRVAWAVLGTGVGAPLRRFQPTLNSAAAAGQALTDLADGSRRAPDERGYAALRSGHLTWIDPSSLAVRDDLAEALWADSAQLVGLDGGASG